MLIDKDILLDFFIKFAPDAPIKKCMYYADKYGGDIKEIYFLKEALAILSEEVIGLSKQGDIPDNLKLKRPSVLWALGKMQEAHGWVTCGPSEGMKTLLERIDKEITETGRRRPL